MALQADQFNRMDALQGGLYDDQVGTIGGNTDVARRQSEEAFRLSNGAATDLRRAGLATNRGTRDANALLNEQALGTSNRRTEDTQWDSIRANNNALMSGLRRSQATRDQNIGDFRAEMASGTGRITDARDANLATYGREKDASLGYFEPSIGRGNDAGAAYAYNLGIGNKPAGYTGLQESEGTKYLMNTGRQEIEGGAAGSGNMYSGATLAALEKKRMGLASLDKANQMGQIMALAGLGQSAANSAAGIRAGYADDVAGERSGAATGINALRGGYTGAIAGERGNYRDVANSLDATRTAGNISARNLGTQTLNALRDQYTQRGMGINNNYQTAQYGIGQDYANATTNAADTRAGRNIDIANTNTANLGAARANRANLAGGNSAQYTTGMSAALANKGDAKAAGAIGGANALMGGLQNSASIYGLMGGQFGQSPQGVMPSVPAYGTNPFANNNNIFANMGSWFK
jgi:hypothetical protein